MDLFPKFIIEDDCLIISKVTQHKKLVTNPENVQGGGWFRWNEDKTMMIFYGDSFEFGKASFEDIKKCVLSGNVYSNKYCTHSITDKHKFAYDTNTEILIIK